MQIGFLRLQLLVIFSRLAETSVVPQGRNRFLDEIDPGTAERRILVVLLVNFLHLLVPVKHGINEFEVRNKRDRLERSLVNHQNPAAAERFEKRLRNDPVAAEILMTRRPFDAHRRPVNRLRLGNTPVHLAVLLIDLHNQFRVELELFPQILRMEIILQLLDEFLIIRNAVHERLRQRRRFRGFECGVKHRVILISGSFRRFPDPMILGIRLQKLAFTVRSGSHSLPVRIEPDHIRDQKSKPVLVVEVRVIHDVSKLMLENPCQFFVENWIFRIVLDRLIPDQLDPFVDPAPPVLKT